MTVAARTGLAAVLILWLTPLACGRSAPSGDAGAGTRSGPAADAAPAGVARGAGRVTLTPEAVRQAGIAIETIHQAPFAVTLSLACRLSPSAETPEEVEARLNFQATEARFRRASAEVERVRKLFSQDVVSAKAVQTAETESAEARVERQRALTALNNLGMDAVHQESFPAADIWALAEIYEPQVSQVKPGTPAWIHVETFSGESFPGRVVSLARFLKPQTRTLSVRIAVQDPRHGLRPQEIGTAEVQTSVRLALSVPASALLYEGTERVLFVRRADFFEKVRVVVGAEQAGRAEILEGLVDGDEVVVRGAQILFGEMFRTRIPSGEEEKDED
jgi:hypothetical protein